MLRALRVLFSDLLRPAPPPADFLEHDDCLILSTVDKL